MLQQKALRLPLPQSMRPKLGPSSLLRRHGCDAYLWGCEAWGGLYLDDCIRALPKRLPVLATSASGRDKSNTLELHLIPVFGSFYVDAIRRSDIEEWKGSMERRSSPVGTRPTDGLPSFVSSSRRRWSSLNWNESMLGVTPFGTSTHHVHGRRTERAYGGRTVGTSTPCS